MDGLNNFVGAASDGHAWEGEDPRVAAIIHKTILLHIFCYGVLRARAAYHVGITLNSDGVVVILEKKLPRGSENMGALLPKKL